ncbi:hypothetical protein StoSoilB19_12390 [Arthrobacter sp. StoSoilB19]|nr:hypothetical protein StoSoilB19_12390 [Arthrobacter sp. StoSoilB19]
MADSGGLPQGFLKEAVRVVAGSGVHANGAVHGPGLGRQGRKGSGQIGTAVVGDHNGSDMDILKN